MKLCTIEDAVENIIVIEKSRFICMLFYIDNEQQAKNIIEQIKEQHPKAVHHCYAYVIKQEFQNIENQSDDGEPSKTAGIPMLDILRHENLVNVLAVVTRYFGGTLLGTGGLIRAYSGSVKQAVDLAKIKEAALMQGYQIKVSYPFYEIMKYEIKNNNGIIKDTKFDEVVTIVFYTENDKLIDYLINKTNNEIEVCELDRVYM